MILFGDTIDGKLKKLLHPVRAATLTTNKNTLPAYRFVDLWNAVQNTFRQYSTNVVSSSHFEDLSALLTQAPPHYHDGRLLNKSTNVCWPINQTEESYLPIDHFWVGQGAGMTMIVCRLRFEKLAQTTILECSAENEKATKSLINSILNDSVANSIYRKQTLRLSFETGSKDEYGDVEKPDRFRVLYQKTPPVTDSDFVIDKNTLTTLRRNIVDLFERRDTLSALGVPIRRGVLLYGPPGTGKTFACRYLAQRLKTATKIFVTGRAMTQVSSVFSIARLLKPSCIFLEDADLAFAARDINADNTNLGDLLDELDGLRTDDEIAVVVTTNSMERLESALKDRPGRISQCIYFGPPVAIMRKRYLKQYLSGFDQSDIDLDKLTAESEGATQAFLKEWVHRAVQISSEGVSAQRSPRTLDFDHAMEEMTRDADYFGKSLIGFASNISK